MALPPVSLAEKIQILANNDETCATFVITEEDHTLGNSLRFMLAKNEDVTFVGYSIPHPSEPKMHLRVQTKGAPVVDVLRKALNDLIEMCDHITVTAESEIEAF